MATFRTQLLNYAYNANTHVKDAPVYQYVWNVTPEIPEIFQIVYAKMAILKIPLNYVNHVNTLANSVLL